MSEANLVVTEKAERPAGEKGRCFHCHRRVGEEHAPECVLVVKAVRLRVTVLVDRTVPAGWTQEDVEFRYGQGTWCADNVIEWLQEASTDRECLCGRTKVEVVAFGSEVRLEEVAR